jgi:Na+/phosphate symporter
MKRILVALRLIPFTQILLLTIAVLLYLNWQEQRNTSYKVDELDNDVLRYLPQIARNMPAQ